MPTPARRARSTSGPASGDPDHPDRTPLPDGISRTEHHVSVKEVQTIVR